MFWRTKKLYAHLEADPGRVRGEWLACDYGPLIWRGYGSHAASPFLVSRPRSSQSPGWKPHLLTTSAPPVRVGSRDQVKVVPWTSDRVFLAQVLEGWRSSPGWGKLRSPLLPSRALPSPQWLPTLVAWLAAPRSSPSPR